MRQEIRKMPALSILMFRLSLIAAFIAAFVPDLNPARFEASISRNASLFTSAIAYETITPNYIKRALLNGWIEQTPLTLTYIGTAMCMLAIAAMVAAFCMSLGNTMLRRRSFMFTVGAALLGLLGTAFLFLAQNMFANSPNIDRLQTLFPIGIWAFGGIFAILLIYAAILWFTLPQPTPEEKDQLSIAPKYSLFLMILPFLVLVALFAYLPLYSWRYAFYHYESGFELTADRFVGLFWFRELFGRFRSDIMRVMSNTFALSGIGIATSWLPIVFAIFLSELKFNPFKRTVQTLTTIPNYISWVLVYSIAFAVFSTEGFFNWMLTSLGLQEQGKNFLMDGGNMWVKMWAWGTWKGLGWGAIIYIAGISAIDPQLYEAAMVDGAGRFKRMWHITVPGLMPTYFVLLLLSIANLLSNGLDQYLVFQNAATKRSIEVLDLYVYNLGFDGSNTSLATLVGMLKSIISVTLLFAANKTSKWLRGESIV